MQKTVTKTLTRIRFRCGKGHEWVKWMESEEAADNVRKCIKSNPHHGSARAILAIGTLGITEIVDATSHYCKSTDITWEYVEE